MREIITLQIGTLSNYIGTHFWNTQEAYLNQPSALDEIDPDVLYRTGRTLSGISTYTPRTLIYDLKGGFGSLEKYNRLFGSENAEAYVNWDQGMNKIERGVKKNKYQQELDRMETDSSAVMDDQIIEQLDKTINNWADYNKVYYHPRSINEISTHEMGNPITPFDNYTIGHKAYEENERESDLFDTNFRFFVEECDRLQGFQLITDVDTGYGGFTVGLLNEVRDEFPKTPILTYGVSDSHAHHENEREKNKIILNRSISLTQISELSSIYVPIYTPTQNRVRQAGLSPYIRFNEYSTYHTSAIIAAGIESNLLPYRLKKNPIAMADNINKLSWVRSTKLGYLSITLPLPISSNGYEDTLHNHTTKQLKPTLSYLNYQPDGSKVDVYAETYITRGLPNPVPSEYIDRIHENSKHDNDPLHDRFNVTTPFPVVDTYPRLFMPCVDMDGLIAKDDSYSTPFSVPAMTEFKSGSELKKLVDEHLRGMERMRYQDFHEYILNGMSYEDFKEIKESLISLSDSYRTDDDSYMM